MIRSSSLLFTVLLAATSANAQSHCTFRDMIDIRVDYNAACVVGSGAERTCTLEGFGDPLFKTVPIGEPLRATCTLTERPDHPDATGSCTLKAGTDEWINLFASLGPRYGGASNGDWSITIGSNGCDRAIGPGEVVGEWPLAKKAENFSGTLIFAGLDRTIQP